jgi:lipid A ethanolaminephosphotransferase
MYLILIGVLPSILILRMKIIKVKFTNFLTHIVLILVFVGSLIYASATGWFWIDKHSKALVGLVMPWSYVANISRFYYHKSQENQQ